jgi:hypothetical protein
MAARSPGGVLGQALQGIDAAYVYVYFSSPELVDGTSEPLRNLTFSINLKLPISGISLENDD